MPSKGPYSVVYLTGSPASGKSTLVAALQERVKPLGVYSYSKLLKEEVADRCVRNLTEDDMRRESAKLITPDDVAAVDRKLLLSVQTLRLRSHIIIDSHAVTKEDFGFRVTPFSIPQIQALAPTMIFVLYAESEIILERIRSNAQGRPTVSIFDATLHTDLQCSVALVYGVHLGIPIYFLDSNRESRSLVDEVARRILRSDV